MRIAVSSVAFVITVAGTFACQNGHSSTEGGDDGGTGTDAGGSGRDHAGDASDDAAGGALPASSFLFVRRVAPGADSLIAVDVVTQEARVITDLRGDGLSYNTARSFEM